jgi:hypothetical protein
MPVPELLRFEAVRARRVTDVVIGAAPDERHLTGYEFHRVAGVVQPQPAPAPYDGVHGQLDRPGQPQSPRRLGHRPREDGTGSAGPREAIVQYVHPISIRRAAPMRVPSSV